MATSPLAKSSSGYNTGTGSSLIEGRFKAITSDMVAYLGRNLNYGYVNTVAQFPGRLDAQRLRRATRLSVDAEPILGCRFVDSWYHPYWQRRNDLDSTPDFFAFVQTRDPDTALEACLTKYMDPRSDPQIHVSLIRNERDRLCIKLNHMVGDGFSGKEYLYLLADIYNNLGENPDYIPPVNYADRELVKEIAKRFDVKHKMRIVRHLLSSVRKDRRYTGSWNFPVSPVQERRLTHAVRVYPDRMEAISRYIRKNRVTIFHILAASFYLALRSTVPQYTTLPLPIIIPISLRRYVHADHPAKMCGLLGGTLVSLDAPANASLDDVVVLVRDQMKAQKEYLGLRSISLISAFPGINLVFKAIPFRLAEKLLRKGARGLLREKRIKTCVLTTGGRFDAARVRFDNQEPEHVYGVGTTTLAALFPVIASMFHQTLTLSVAFSEELAEKTMVESVLEKMDHFLPK